MAENSTRVEVRKLRKKLRQIEHLERLERDLTDEEYQKVRKKSDIRELLKGLLKKLEQEREIENVSQTMDKNLSFVKDMTGEACDPDRQVPAEETTNVPDNESINKKSSSKTVECFESSPVKDIARTTPVDTNSSQEEQKATHSSNPGKPKNPETSSSGPSAFLDKNASTSNMKLSKKQSNVFSSLQWQDRKFSVQCLEGHNDQISSVDMDESLLISGSRDTMLKLWDCDQGKEVRSMGGHTGGITSVVLVKKDDYEGESSDGAYLGVTGSHDCSIRIWSLGDGKSLRSIYAYSPVLCLDRRKGNLVSGSESGKVELWDLESGENIRSARSDDDSVTCIKFQDERIASGSSNGTVKVWDVRQRSLLPALTSDSVNSALVKKRRVNCLAATDDVVYWGDDGTNIKVLDIRAGKVRKLKNHLTEFGSTSAMVIQDSLLISSGYDLDKGTGYLNVRTLPDEQYLATLDDDVTNYISCLCSVNITKDEAVYQRLCTGGNELKVWDQMSRNKIRKRPRAEDSSFVTSKHLRRYSSAEQIDTESSDESDGERRDDSSDDDEENDRTTTNARQSWCTIS